MKTNSGSRALGRFALPLFLFAVILVAGCVSQGGMQGSPTTASQPSVQVVTQKPAELKTAICGNGVKEAGETFDNCCRDAGCPSTFECDSKIVNGLNVSACKKMEANASSAPTNLCVNQSIDAGRMDIFDSHTHINSKISASQIISEMDKAGVSVSNLYGGDSSSLEAMSQYPGRFIAFVDTPDSPQPSTWFTQGQAFVAFAESQLKTGKFYGIGETNLRYYNGRAPISPPDIYIPPDSLLWLQLVNMSARYHVPISFHFIPDDPVANAAFEKMLSYNKDATLIWAHLGFNDMPLNHATLNDFLLRYPNLYFDTAGIQNMQNPLPKPNSNWAVLANQSSKGQLNEEWKQFFETWNSRFLFGSDAGGGGNGRERWLNYADDSVSGATPNAVGHWKSLFSNLDYNAARNIMSGNSRGLFLKEQKPSYNYLVSSDGSCYYSILVSSNSSVSGLVLDPVTNAITFTVADSIATTGSATITIPTSLAGGNFIAQVDGQSVQIKETSNSTYTIINLEYAGGIRLITLSATGSNSNN